MFFLKKLLTALILPPTGPILLALCGLWLTRRHPRLGRGLALGALLGLLALATPRVADALMQSLERYAPITAPDLARAQAIVILGGGTYYAAPEYGGDTVGRWALERVRYGVYLQRRSRLPILATGGAPQGGRPEALTMQDAIERDLGGQVKWLETASRDTAENARFSARILKAAGISRIALVSHGWHLPRAVACFEREGLQVFPAPTAYRTHAPDAPLRLMPTADALLGSSKAVHEWLGILAQQLAH